MLHRSTKNVLGCGLALLLLSSCASLPPSITVSTKPIEKPTLIVPPIDQVTMKEVKWIIVTEENLEEVIAELKTTIDKSIDELTEDFPIQRIRFSKYSFGIEKLYSL